MNNNFYTLKGYELREFRELTASMEDYLEMIYRMYINNEEISNKEICNYLHVKKSSVSKMLSRLKEKDLIIYQKYGKISLTDKGYNYGNFLFNRHEILVKFFQKLNKDNYKLEQVEKIEHFIDDDTIFNINRIIDLI